MRDGLIHLAACFALALSVFMPIAFLVGYLTRRAQKRADEMNEEFRRLSEKTGRVYPRIYVD